MKEIEKISKNLGLVTKLSLSLLMFATMALVQGCSEERVKEEKKKGEEKITNNATKYELLSFGGVNNKFVGRDGGLDFIKMGRSGNGGLALYGNYNIKEQGDVKKNNGVVSVYDPKSDNVTHVPLIGGSGDGTPGNANLQRSGIAKYDAARIDRIVPGPSGTNFAVLSVSNLEGGAGAFVEMEGEKVKAAWYQNSDHLGIAKGTLKARNEAFKISAVGRTDKDWVGFIDSANVEGGTHAPFAAAPGPASAGPLYASGQEIIRAMANKGDTLFLATFDPGPRNTDGKVNRVNGVDGKIDFAKDIVVKPEDLFGDKTHNEEHNGEITCIAVVGDVLLIGLKPYGAGYPGSIEKNTGGVAAYDLASNKMLIKPTYLGWTVNSIDVSIDGKTAIVSAIEGIIFYADGKLATPENTLTVFPVDKANANTPGFTNNSINFKNAVGAADIGSKWLVLIQEKGAIVIEKKEGTKVQP